MPFNKNELGSQYNKIVVTFLLSLISYADLAQEVAPVDSVKSKKRFMFTGLPIVFYTPETRFGFGATALTVFNFKNDSVRAPRSTASLNFVYTQNRQVLLSLPFNLFIRNRSYQVYGEVGFNHYFYNFYGVGNDEPENYVERYGIEFPRIRFTALKKIYKSFYAGLRYAYDHVELFALENSGKLIDGTIPGSQGGIVSGLGAVFLYDNRDNIFYPSKGIWTELVLFHDDPKTGSTFKYNRIAFDLATYLHYQENILALNLYTIYSDSDLPFFQMGNLGGMKKMRGFYEGRYRDNNLLVFQAEYRRRLFWLLGFTVFGDVGQVAARYDQLNASNWRYTYGLGLRLMLNEEQKINLRFDLAVGNNKILPYFTVSEAF